MKRLIFLFLFIFLLAITVNGAGLSVKTTVVDNLILVGEDAIFDITVKNDQGSSDRVTFLITDLNWEWEKKFFDISPGRSEQFRLRLKAPESTIKPDRYSINLKVYSTLDSSIYVYEPLLVNVFDESSFLKLEKIDSSVRGLDPSKDSNVIKVTIKNRYDKPIDNAEIFLESDIFDTVSKKVNFNEAELKTEGFSVDLNGAIEGWHDINVIVKRGSSVLLDDIGRVMVGKHPDIKEDKEIISGFMTKNYNIIKRNEGSTISEEVYRLRLTSFERSFSNVDPEPSFIEKSGDDYYYVWNFNIKPGEEYRISVEINYRDPLFLLIALIVIVWLIAYLVESGISIKKKALTIKSKDGISYMKVLLMIKNRGKKEIKNLRIVDQLFNVKTVPSDYGTLRPSKVNRSGDSVVLVWDNINLVGKEERIISYRVNIEIRNKMRLPGALVRYKVRNRPAVTRSNSVFIVG